MKKIDLYKEGDVLELVRVRFPGQTRPGSFLIGDFSFDYGQKVVAMSERGMTVGFVHSVSFKVPYAISMGPVKSIVRIATSEDELNFKDAYQKQRAAWKIFERLAVEHRLEMKLKDIEYSSNGKRVSFYYSAPTRVDFRELLKSLKSYLKHEIELRQIPEGFSALSEIGPCGPELCLFINSLMESDCINKKKCNEYNCRLDYKDPFYEDKRSRLPKVGDLISTYTGERGRVEHLDLWNEEFELLTDQGVLKRYVSELWKETLNKKSISFPKKLENISNETKNVVGLTEMNVQKEQARTLELEQNQESARAFAKSVFDSLFGE